MTGKNHYIESVMESWFTETYTIGNDLKKYIDDKKIQTGIPMTIDQAIGLMKIINAIESLKLKVSRACIYMHNHPEEFTDNAKETNKAINKAFRWIESFLMNGYKSEANRTIQSYIENRRSLNENFAFDGELKLDEVPTKEALLEQLRSKGPQNLSTRYLARVRWKLAIAEVIKKNRSKNERWNDANDTVMNYFNRVEEEVKTQVRDIVQDQYGVLLKQHEAFMKWLSLYEEAVLQAEKNISKLFENLDGVANRKARLIQLFLRGSISAALSPFMLQNFIDPTLTMFNDIIARLDLYSGDIELNLSQTQTLYQMTGFLPDPDKRTYRNAYEILSKETFYDQIGRYKKYLQHKMDSLSETRELCEMMSEDSSLWGHHTTREVLHAHLMKMIDVSHYGNSSSRIKQPENENAMISAMVKPFETMIKSAFSPMQTQYGNKENLRALCHFIDKITFDDNRVGPESHRLFQNNALVKMMANHVEIYFIVKYLVESSTYFGANSHKNQFHRDYLKIDPNDTAFGLSAEDTSVRELVSTLLKRLILIDNPTLKKTLMLDTPGLSEKKLIKKNPLMQSSGGETAHHRLSHCLRGVFISYRVATSEQHRIRQEMIKAIIEEYYNQDISQLLQKQVVGFAQTHGVNLSTGGDHPDPSHAVIEPHWLSENELKHHVHEQIKPFIEQVEEQKYAGAYFGKLGLMYYRDKALVTEASNARAIEKTEENMSKQASRIIFKG